MYHLKNRRITNDKVMSVIVNVYDKVSVAYIITLDASTKNVRFT